MTARLRGAKLRALLGTLTLRSGNHASREEGVCVMEAVAYVAGEPHSDHPKCASKVITAFLVSWNDAIPTDADRDRLLKPLIASVIGTADGAEMERRLAFMAIDWFVRVHTPEWLDLAGLQGHAAAVRATKEIVDEASLDAASAALSAAESAALSAAASAALSAARSAAGSAALSAALSGARSAALSAARSAALSAAESAALSAARSAARSAALSAARSAALSAARSAAESAAEKKLAPTKEKLQLSAVGLVRRMVAEAKRAKKKGDE
jgi:hypothetical protein